MTLQMGWGFLWSAGSTGFARVSIRYQWTRWNANSSKRNTAQCSMESTRTRLPSVKVTNVSTVGKHTKGESWHPQLQISMNNNYTLLGPMTVQYQYGILRAVSRAQKGKSRSPATSCLSLCKTLYHLRQYLPGPIMLRIADVELPFFGPCSKSMALRRRC